MKILVNDVAASSGGAKSILLDFYQFLVDSKDQNTWYFLLSEPLIEETENIQVILIPQVKKSWLHRLWFDHVSGRKRVAEIAPDAVLNLQNTLVSCDAIPQYLYVHQSLPFQQEKNFRFFRREERIFAIYQYLIGYLIKRSVRRADGVFVQTQWMKEAVSKYTAEEKIAVITPSVSVEKQWCEQEPNIQTNQFFYPAGGAIYKNHQAIFEAVKGLREEGIADFNVELTLEAPANAHKVPEQIRWVGALPRSTVMEQYKRKVLVFPSYIETFGLPLAEARMMRGMIFAADTPFAREILEGYENAWFFDPFEPEELKELMRKGMSGEICWMPTKRTEARSNTWGTVVDTIQKKRILFLTNIPSPYRVDFFNELGKLCNLTVLFEKGASDERDKSWNEYQFQTFRGVLLQGKKTDIDKAFSPTVIKYLKKDTFDTIIVANTATPTGMLAIQYMKLRRIPYWIEGDGAFPKKCEGIKKYIKQHFIKGAQGYFSTSEMHDRYYLTYGADPKRVHRYPFTPLKESDIAEQVPSAQEKAALRTKQGLAERKIVLAVGQFIPRKGFDILIQAMAKLPSDIGCYIVGGRPPQTYNEKVTLLGLKNVHFVDFMTPAVLSEYYLASDVFVLPTREDVWGLVINEAMAKGLPVITTERCVAGLELVQNGVNGYLVPVGDVLMLTQKLELLLENEELREQMAQESLKKIRSYTIENMARVHMEVLKKVEKR